MSPGEMYHYMPSVPAIPEPPVNADSDVMSSSSSDQGLPAIYRPANTAKYMHVNDYQPIDLPSGQQPITVPTECLYDPWSSPPKHQ